MSTNKFDDSEEIPIEKVFRSLPVWMPVHEQPRSTRTVHVKLGAKSSNLKILTSVLNDNILILGLEYDDGTIEVDNEQKHL